MLERLQRFYKNLDNSSVRIAGLEPAWGSPRSLLRTVRIPFRQTRFLILIKEPLQRFYKNLNNSSMRAVRIELTRTLVQAILSRPPSPLGQTRILCQRLCLLHNLYTHSHL
jgi:hypothetical protein